MNSASPPTSFEQARQALADAALKRAARDNEFAQHWNEAQYQLSARGALLAATTKAAIRFLAADLGSALQDGADDALHHLSHSTANEIWSQLSPEGRTTLGHLDNNDGRQLLAKLMVDLATQWQR